MASNFHFLLFLYTNKFVEFKKDEIKNLCLIISKKDLNEAIKWAKENTNFATLLILIEEINRTTNKNNNKKKLNSEANNNNIGENSGEGINRQQQIQWTCKHCKKCFFLILRKTCFKINETML
jgi:hypothetical protein